MILNNSLSTNASSVLKQVSSWKSPRKPKTRVVVRSRKQLVSVVIPVFNERKNISILHKELLSFLSKAKLRFELLYIDDHSTDGTASYLKKIATGKRIRTFKKNGKTGKAYSLMEGFEKAKGDILVMIDGDMQYPPSAIPKMVQKLGNADVIVSNRKKYHDSAIRRVMSKTFRYIFGKKLFDLELDIQSGLKAMKKEVFQTVLFTPSSGWTFDLEFLHRAKQAGFVLLNHDIVFSPRQHGKSHVKFFKTTWELGTNALSVKFRKIHPLSIPPKNKLSMIGAGVGFKKNRYITHTTLAHEDSAMKTFEKRQIVFMGFVLGVILFGLMTRTLATARTLVAVLSMIYFIDVLFNMFIILKSLRFPREITFDTHLLSSLKDSGLPRYSILCPLYREAHVIPQFLQAISHMDWPTEKLEVMLLLEEDDEETIVAIRGMKLPGFVRIAVVPHSFPKTKPKACNYGLSLATGDYVVIYDAEDIPDPLQLKKAHLAFQQVGPEVICLQAKLNYYNPNQNLLTRFFTAEYSLWFDLTLPGLQSINASIPLGGTSNHFRIEDLKTLKAWDPFNVTEDADLGVRLFKAGFTTAIIDSTTLEEANSKVKNWVRQRSRWLKGYMQTYLVHMRKTRAFAKDKGIHALIFQLTVGGKLAFILINPFLWLLTVSYFALYSIVGEAIETLYLGPVLYLAVTSLILGNFLFIFYYMIGCAKRQQWHLIKYILLIPIYWFMISFAAGVALYQLLFKPHYWEKTIHGLHLKPVAASVKPAILPVPAFANPSWRERLNRKGVSFLSRLMERKLVTTFPGNISKLFVLSWVSTLLYAGVDIIFAGMYMQPGEFGIYALLSLLGKTVLLTGSIGIYLLISLMHVSDMAKKASDNALSVVLLAVFVLTATVYAAFGVYQSITLPVLFGSLAPLISPYAVYFLFGMITFVISRVFVHFYQAKKIYAFSLGSILLTVLQLIFLSNTNHDIRNFVEIMFIIGGLNLILMIVLHVNRSAITSFEANVAFFLSTLRKPAEVQYEIGDNMRILIMNWRDMRHKWSGGAEVYIHELAKNWVSQGHIVTLFCGNDRKSPKKEVVDGVEIIRAGGTYTVYLFAFFYYLFVFRGKYDVVIDGENGIPFFAGFYAREPVFLLIHHVHQKVFRQQLHFPLSSIAAFLESKLMPFVYRNKTVITVSESSKKEIVKLGFTDPENIQIIHNGINKSQFSRRPKTTHPTFLYLGRLKSYKNIDVAIRAFSQVVRVYPESRLRIVGFGESMSSLKKQVTKLNLDASVSFLGRVSERQKAKLLSESWVVLQPSMLEGWGITVLEANASGTPVIASRVNGLVDSVIDGKTGMLVNPGSDIAFSQAMLSLILDKELLNQFGRQAYIWSQSFDWNTSAFEFLSLIERSLLTGKYQIAYGKVIYSEDEV